MYYFYMACLIIFVAVLFYIFGLLQSWYEQILTRTAGSDSVTDTNHAEIGHSKISHSENGHSKSCHSENGHTKIGPAKIESVFRPRAIFVRHVRHFLKPRRAIPKPRSNTKPTEQPCAEMSKHEKALAEAGLKIEVLMKAAWDDKIPLGESLYLRSVKEDLQCIIEEQEKDIQQLKETNARHRPISSLNSLRNTEAEQEVADLKTRLAASEHENQLAKSQI